MPIITRQTYQCGEDIKENGNGSGAGKTGVG